MTNNKYIFDDRTLMSEWNWNKNNELGLSPNSLTLTSHKKVFWKCKICNNEWQTTIYHRSIKNQSCPVCTNRAIKIGVNDLKTTNPLLAREWNYEKNNITPEQITAGSHTKVWWICSKCGFEWQSQVKSRNNGCGCPVCAKKYRKKPIYTKPRNVYVANEKSLSYLFPEISKEWDFQKNKLNPNQVGAYSKLKVWWKCSNCNYEYERQIRNRTKRNNSCPKCSTKNSTSVNIGINDLRSQNSRIAKEWNYEKNGDLKPENVSVNSGRKVWWICPFGHEYQSVIRDRNSGTNCPICNKRNSSSFPEQAIFYYIKKVFPDAVNKYKDIFKNSMELDIYISSIQVGIEYDGKHWHHSEKDYLRELKKYEICKKNNITLIRIKEKIKNLWHDTADSIYILNKTKNNDLLERYIYDILRLLDVGKDLILDNKDESKFYNKVSIDIERDKFEIYSYLTEIENSIAKIYPPLVAEWNYDKNGNLKPEMFTAGSNEKVWWKCKTCDSEWQAVIRERVNGVKKCPICKKSQNK